MSKNAFDELNNKHLRLIAEFDNFKRRTSDEKSQNFKYGAIDILGTILPFFDNFKRANASCPEDIAQTEFWKGMLGIETNLVKELEKK
ncbi:nucleotide exchange factor GrpE [Candidatus Venteria ishoeyi]|uniref:nucleotide exchange factor GrpE n=1 Tax=Candidatus Venteria ishoeyi TaxID=1899563 RepID=UPI000CDF2061